VLSARSGDLRETDNRRYNPHVLPFHHFSFESFDGHWGQLPRLRVLLIEKGFSTYLRAIIVETFHKELDVMFTTARYRTGCKGFVSCRLPQEEF
jgi:hypothetical protein